MPTDRREKKANYRAANREQISAYNKAYRAKNKEKLRLKDQARRESGAARIAVDKYQAANPDKVRIARRRWRDENPEYGPKYYLSNRERMCAQRAAWDKANPEKTKSRTRNRRARLKGASGSHSADDIRELRRLQRNKCASTPCRKSLEGGYHVDHILPLIRGGSNDRRNLQLLCQACNQAKHTKAPLEWARANGVLV